MPQDDHTRAVPLGNLSCIASSRYDLLEDVQDVGLAIGYAEEDLAVPLDGLDQTKLLGNFGFRFSGRYNPFGPQSTLRRLW